MGSLRSTVRSVPVDLLAAVGLTLALNAVVFVPGLRNTALRVPLGFVFACLVPGYVVVAALFPARFQAERADRATGAAPASRETDGTDGVTLTERLLLAVGLSFVVVPVIGYAWNFTSQGIRLTPVLLSVSAFTIGVAVLAALRRWRVPDGTAFHPLASSGLDGVQSPGTGSGASVVVNAVLVVALLVFAASAGYAFVELSPDEQYSEFYLLSGDGETLTGADEPPALSPGDRETVRVAVENHIGQPTEYTVVVVQQTLGGPGTGTDVSTQTRLDRFTVAVDHNETAVRDYTFTAPPGDDQSRVVWLLYPDEVPESVSTASAPNHVYLWVAPNASEPASRPPA